MPLKLTINGNQFEADLSRLSPNITLNTYIREHVGLTGTKFMCLEGGCGVCICVIRSRHPVSGKERISAVNSCLTLLNICDGWDVTTIEGIGSKLNGYHPIQQQLANLHGSQCGYCSPGIVMNMYGLLASAAGEVTMKEVENSFGGNICRCTGYRPILDAMKSFAMDSDAKVECRDIEDLGIPCPKTGERCGGLCKMSPVDYKNGAKWFWPSTLSDLYNIVKSVASEEYMLVAGNTAHGVYRRSEDIANFIDVNRISDLHTHSMDESQLILGANLSLTEAMEIFQNAAFKIAGFEYCQELHSHFDLIANVAVRNMGTLAGNLMLKHKYPEFSSDVFVTFEAVNVMVAIGYDKGTRSVPLAEFLKTDMRGRVVISFTLKPYPSNRYIFRSFKIMPRAQNAHAYVNAAFLLEMNRASGRVDSARICFGGISPTFTHAYAAENIVKRKYLFSNDVLLSVFEWLYLELKPDSVPTDASVEYRRKLACGLFYKFILSVAPRDRVNGRLKSGGETLKRPLSSGRQKFATNLETYPIAQPVKKLEAMVQCSGEAEYMNDLPLQLRQVWCAFVGATRVGVKITTIDAADALKVPGVLAFYSAKDIPGVNSFVNPKFMFIDEDEEIFCSGKVKYHNQPVGMIVADSSELANFAASKVIVSYSDENPKVFSTIKDVLQANQLDRMIDIIVSPIKEFKLGSQVSVSASGALELGLQYHFTMEPHSTVAVPIEGRLEVYSSTQGMDLTQYAIAKCLQMNISDVKLKVRRLGGGFGAKITRSNHAACAASIAAVKLNRPARFVQTLESMMATVGKRWACYSEYEFYTTSAGRIIGLQNMIYEDGGHTTSENAITDFIEHSMRSCYDFRENLKIDAKIVLTDATSHTWCRAPNTLEGFAMIENVMEHIAFETRLDPADVRLENIAADHIMRALFAKFLHTTDYRQRRRQIDSFNDANRWRKRGIGISLMQFHVVHFAPFPATVSIYHGDGTVVVSHGGVEMGQGLNTKVAQVAAYILGVPLEMIRIEASDTLNGANTMFTGASIGSESVCFAVRKACEVLLERLRPIRETMQKAAWPLIVEEAHGRGVNLIASVYYKLGDLEPYFVYGMSLTEVEIDILTGNHLISRVDILEDTGKSLNPTVDVGQIEGAFVMGLGYYLTEQLIYDRATGELLTTRSWNYKPPGCKCKDIPIDFRIELVQVKPNAAGFMRSKTTGEPGICLAVSVLFAIQHALQSARKDAGLTRKWISLGAPTTPEHIVLNSGSDVSQFKL